MRLLLSKRNHYYMHRVPFNQANSLIFQEFQLQSPRNPSHKQPFRSPKARIRPYCAYKYQKVFVLYAFSCENELCQHSCGVDRPCRTI